MTYPHKHQTAKLFQQSIKTYFNQLPFDIGQCTPFITDITLDVTSACVLISLDDIFHSCINLTSIEYHCHSSVDLNITNVTDTNIVSMAINVKTGEPTQSTLKALIKITPKLKSLLVNWCSYSLPSSLFDNSTTMNVLGIGNIVFFRFAKQLVCENTKKSNNIRLFSANNYTSIQDIETVLKNNKKSLQYLYTPAIWNDVTVRDDNELTQDSGTDDEHNRSFMYIPSKMDSLKCLRIQNVHLSQPWVSLYKIVQTCPCLRALAAVLVKKSL